MFRAYNQREVIIAAIHQPAIALVHGARQDQHAHIPDLSEKGKISRLRIKSGLSGCQVFLGKILGFLGGIL